MSTKFGMNQPKGHPLSMGTSPQTKQRAANQLDAIKWVQQQYNVAVSTEMAYKVRNLQRIPHCDAAVVDKSHADKILQQNGVQVIDIGANHSLTGEGTPINVFRKNHSVVSSLRQAKVSDKSRRVVLDYLMQSKNEILLAGNENEVRDAGECIRLDLGFTQGQLCSDRFVDSLGRKHDEIKIPLARCGPVASMDTECREAVGNILKYFQSVLLLLSPNAVNDEVRSRLARERFGDVLWPGKRIIWE